jgi:hypothetical protein
MKMPAKLDSSTPATQNGFELLGTARITEKERSPLLNVGETAVGGGLTGPIGSTRIWFRLPPANGNGLGIPSDDELQAYVSFPNGERYPVRWEMGELDQRIVTLLIPGGFPPSEWIDIHLEGPLGKTRWRFQRIPQTPYALPPSGRATVEAEDLKVTASGVALARKGLGTELGQTQSPTIRIDYTVDPPFPKRGKGTRLFWESFVPEYQHPGDEAKPTILGISSVGERQGSVSLTFPYGDLMRHVGARGRLEVWDVVREPVLLKNVRWTKDIPLEGAGALQLETDRAQFGDGSFFQLRGSVPVMVGVLRGKPSFDGYFPPPVGKEQEVHRYHSSFDPIPEATIKSWEPKLKALAQSRNQRDSVLLGSLPIVVEYYRVTRKTSFELLVPVRQASPEEIAKEQAQAVNLRPNPSRPGSRTNTRQFEVKTKPVVVE